MDSQKPIERQIVSDEVYEEINSRPPWIIRNGLGSICLIIILVGTCAALIGYPEAVPVTIKIHPSIRPFRISLPDSSSPRVLAGAGRQVIAGEKIAVVNLRGSNARQPLLAPGSGKLYIGYDYNQMSTVLQIVPDSVDYSIWGLLDEGNTHKISLGMDVRIPMRTTYGTTAYLHGKIAAISSYVIDHKYSLRILPDNRVNDFADQLFADDGSFVGSGEIEVSNSSILSRIFVQVFHLKHA
jgi:hypothetical protein